MTTLETFRDTIAAAARDGTLRDGLIGENILIPGLTGEVPRVYADYVASGRALATRLLDRGGDETAIFVGSDELAIGTIEILRERGVRIPQDMSLISFDGARALHLYDPPITAVLQPARMLGERAVELLLDGNWKDQSLPDLVEYLPVALIERASVAAPNRARQTRAGKAHQPDRGE